VKSRLAYVAAGIAGVLVAVLLFGPGMGDGGDDDERPASPSKTEAPEAEAPTATRTEAPDDAEEEPARPRSSEDVIRAYHENPPPPPGTLRPLNKAEIELQERLERSYNKHYAHVASWWTRAAQILSKRDKALAGDVAELEAMMREQSQLNEIDERAIITREREIIRKIQDADLGDSELDIILSYVDQSAGVVLQGGDPSTVPKPKTR
jgi:hypothetical protein